MFCRLLPRKTVSKREILARETSKQKNTISTAPSPPLQHTENSTWHAWQELGYGGIKQEEIGPLFNAFSCTLVADVQAYIHAWQQHLTGLSVTSEKGILCIQREYSSWSKARLTAWRGRLSRTKRSNPAVCSISPSSYRMLSWKRHKVILAVFSRIPIPWENAICS